MVARSVGIEGEEWTGEAQGISVEWNYSIWHYHDEYIRSDMSKPTELDYTKNELYAPNNLRGLEIKKKKKCRLWQDSLTITKVQNDHTKESWGWGSADLGLCGKERSP